MVSLCGFWTNYFLLSVNKKKLLNTNNEALLDLSGENLFNSAVSVNLIKHHNTMHGINTLAQLARKRISAVQPHARGDLR